VRLKRAEDLAFTDVSAWVDRAGYEPPSADLRGQITLATVRLVNPTGDLDGVIPFVPREGLAIELLDGASVLVFGGYVANPVAETPGPGTRAWELTCQSWAARMAESSTGSLNKSGVIASDRDFLIAMFRDALGAGAQVFGSDTAGVEDAIVTANEAIGWSGVAATTFLYGTDWSYRTLLDVVQDLLNRVPGTSLRIRPNRIVEYGALASPAPFVLAGFPSAAIMADANVAELVAGSYHEEVLAAGHVNKVRLGGAGAAEEIAYDQVSHGVYGRVMEAPYENDEDIPANDLRRAVYAKLARFAPRRVAKGQTYRDGVEAGMLLPVIVDELGCAGDEGWGIFPGEIYLGSPLGEPASGYRGEMLVQKVNPTFVGPGVQVYDLELGSYVPDLDRALAERIGETAGG
jgi:hypothetical protein